VLEYQPPHPVADAATAPHGVLPGASQALSSSVGEGLLPKSHLPPGTAAGASGAPHSTVPDPAPRPQSRNLAESLQAAAAARQRDASLAAPAPMVAAADALPLAPREASTVVITEVPPSPEQSCRQGTETTAPRQQTEPSDARRTSHTQVGATVAAIGRAEPALSSVPQKPKAAAAVVSAERPAKLSPTKPAVADAAAPELTDADFNHLPPHLRPKYAGAALQKTAARDGPASRPGSLTLESSPAAVSPSADAAAGANCSCISQWPTSSTFRRFQCLRSCCDEYNLALLAFRDLHQPHGLGLPVSRGQRSSSSKTLGE